MLPNSKRILSFILIMLLFFTQSLSIKAESISSQDDVSPNASFFDTNGYPLRYNTEYYVYNTAYPTMGVTYEVWAGYDYLLLSNNASPGTAIKFRPKNNDSNNTSVIDSTHEIIIVNTSSNWGDRYYWSSEAGDVALKSSPLVFKLANTGNNLYSNVKLKVVNGGYEIKQYLALTGKRWLIYGSAGQGDTFKFTPKN